MGFRRSVFSADERMRMTQLLPQAPIARLPSDTGCAAIDPVETGFPGAGMSRETQFFITACETANRRIPAMEVTPPEYQPGSA
jgi:hypothetical protein